MAAAETVSSGPVVSIIVPARNEETCLGRCLESLVAQSGVRLDIVVVDDESTDRTREIAQLFPSVRVVEAGRLPAGWTGKNNAMTAGASVARGEWLLFTDADTVHAPGSLARAVAEAQQRGAAAVKILIVRPLRYTSSVPPRRRRAVSASWPQAIGHRK